MPKEHKRAAKDEHDKIVINPTFDNIFTLIFLLEVIFCFYCFYVRSVENSAKADHIFDNDLAVFTLVRILSKCRYNQSTNKTNTVSCHRLIGDLRYSSSFHCDIRTHLENDFEKQTF